MVGLRVSAALGTLRQTTLVKPISNLQKALEQETDALKIIDAIDFGNEVQGFLFNRPHGPLRT